MIDQVSVLLRAIRRWCRRIVAGKPMGAGTIDPKLLPPPQVTWPLVGLIHYVQRKQWAFETLKERLAANIPSRS
jgi:hypothetical protein